MDTNTLKIICYTGGTCGDLLSALIDPLDCIFQNKTVFHDIKRQRLKKPHTFSSDEEKDQYLNEIAVCYNSVPSHDLNYHVLRKHSFISITVQDFNTALWAATRFQRCHRPHVWKEMTDQSGADTIEKYAQLLIDYSVMVAQHTENVVQLEHIRNGLAIESLEKCLNYTLTKPARNLYQNWLDLQNNTFII